MVSGSGSAMAKSKTRKTKIGHRPETTAAYKKRFLEKLAQEMHHALLRSLPTFPVRRSTIGNATTKNFRRRGKMQLKLASTRSRVRWSSVQSRTVTRRQLRI